MDELNKTKELLLLVTSKLLSNCAYCIMISTDPHHKTPIYCTKFSGSCNPILVNVTTCLTCCEYQTPKQVSGSDTTDTHIA